MNIAVILASGSGTRVGESTPKQFIRINGKPLILYSLEQYQQNKNIDSIIVVTNKEYIPQVEEWCDEFEINKVQSIVPGGDTRQKSSYCGIKELERLHAKDEDNILIQDSARALTGQELIDNGIKACQKYGAVNTVFPVSDTIIVSRDGLTIDSIPDRKELFLGQTPQCFKFKIIKKAHELTKQENATDDCSIVSELGVKIYLTKGSKTNFKITTKEDLKLFEEMIKK